ncbi:unnamed protein product [Didymodactylos carnosus]|uniref:Macro domain-containing protein n=1 Tax=Didymodactylos carnosus TaxID=1234261 RepID=A0A813Z8P4_9BILA|nr:unnamed protein product [Didymodactylos carnosus]CAF1123587.1 unnamed protein product [Didymodactylos carnosus]CAF3679010.1 unnamed protein product [Didymodactylos carnosus]CAF3899596.1 unnamed protein product [Didymodactylos carnosus]
MAVKGSDANPDFCFNEIEGDLFQSPDNNVSLAHCVSEDMEMSKGIATLFRDKFGRINELKQQGVVTGGVAYLKADERYIFYLVTKKFYYHKPTMKTLQSSLEAMKERCQEFNVVNLAIPKIGCGLDKLNWTKVSEMIKDIFQDLPIKITVYHQKK